MLQGVVIPERERDAILFILSFSEREINLRQTFGDGQEQGQYFQT